MSILFKMRKRKAPQFHVGESERSTSLSFKNSFNILLEGVWSLFPHTGEFHRDAGDAFDPPGADSEPGTMGRQWSSLKSSAATPAAREEDRERTKSLPAYGSIV